MSAFICGDETIQKCMLAILVMNEDDHYLWSHYAFNGMPTSTPDDLTKIGGLLFNLNVQAVCERYSDNEFEQATFKFVPPASRSKERAEWISYYKALQCLKYQCSEGEVPKLDEYKALEKLIGDFACYIVDKMPEYEKAQWG